MEEFVSEICDMLNIRPPKISYDTSHFQSDTMMAQVDSSGDTIYINKCDKLNPDQLFSIAHELRHIWQMNDREQYLSDYKSIDQCSSVEEYNLQIAELDANAFAGFVMVSFFHLKPQFNGIPKSVRLKIYNRIGRIAESLD